MRDVSEQARTVVDLIQARHDEAPHRVAYTVLKDGEAEDACLTWSDVDRRARAIGVWLSSQAVRGERVVLLFPTALEFVVAFFGCLYAGVTAVPAYPLDPARLVRTRSRLRWMLEDCSPRLVLTTSRSREIDVEIGHACEGLPDLGCGYTDTVSDDYADHWTYPDITEESVAVIQYTSGSIADPKGVLVSHKNILVNSRMIRCAHGYDKHMTIVSWVPLAHDWGLINSVIQPAYVGGRSVLMGTEAFLRKPVRWLRAVAGCEEASSGGPNFAYDLCCRKVTPGQCDGLDLSNWKFAGVAAGPVRADTLQEFTTAFGRYGFSADSFYSGYGLAEATLLVSDSERVRHPRVLRVDRKALQRHIVLEAPPDDDSAAALVSCGSPPDFERVVIVHPETREPLAVTEVGEIWVAGENVAKGYWNRPTETEDVFGACTSTGDGPYLRTGDLGFLQCGELFVCGRLKDLIIVRGANIYPQDIEYTAERSHEALRRGCSAAFAVSSESDERLVVVQELRRTEGIDVAAVGAAMLKAILGEHGVLAESVLVNAGAVPKTSSGKPQRNACRAVFLSGTLDVIWHRVAGASRDDASEQIIEPMTPTEAALVAIWEDVVDVSCFSTVEPFLETCDSVTAAQCLTRVCSTFGIDVPLRTLFIDVNNIVELAAYIDTISDRTSPSSASRKHDGSHYRSAAGTIDSGRPPKEFGCHHGTE